MPDFPKSGPLIDRMVHSTGGLSTLVGQMMFSIGTGLFGSNTWPAANRALYLPFAMERQATAYKMAFHVATQSGNYDIGIYDEFGNRLVSTGSTAVPAAGIAVADIADTVLIPGIYFNALCIDNTTCAVRSSTSPVAELLRLAGVQQQAVGAVTLPNPATFANPASAYVPQLSVAMSSVV